MPFPPIAIANRFLSAHGGDDGIDHMKLQKLAFYAYGWWIAYHTEPLMTEGPQVWQYGPVFRSLYAALANYGMTPIPGPQRAVPVGPIEDVPESAGEERNLIDWVWGRYGQLSAGQLSDMTHKAGTPWQIEAAQHQYRVPKFHPIPNKTIKTYFKTLSSELVP